MRARLISSILILATVLCLAGAAHAGVSGLTLAVEGSMDLAVSWDNPDGVRCRVYTYVDGLDTYYETTTNDDNIVLTVVPGVRYRIVVEDIDAGTTIEDTIDMPAAEAYRKDGYRVSKRRVYVYTDAEKAMWNQSYNNLNNITREELLKGIEDGKVYALYFEVGFNRTSEAKVIDPMLVLKTPTGDIYTRFDNRIDFDGSWTGARFYLTFNDLISICDNLDGLVPGKYSMEAYQDGLALGSGTFTVVE